MNWLKLILVCSWRGHVPIPTVTADASADFACKRCGFDLTEDNGKWHWHLDLG